MYRHFNYPVTLQEQPEGGYAVIFPDLPEAITQGETVEEALHEAADCLEEAIANRIALHLPIPTPSALHKDQHSVLLHATLAAKAALYLTIRDAKLSNTSVAKKLACDEKEIRRLLDPHYRSKLPRIEWALEQLGQRLLIGFGPAC